MATKTAETPEQDPRSEQHSRSDCDRYAHVTGDYYIDREAYPGWAWASAAILCIVLPPVGVFFAAFFAVSSITADTD